MSLNESPRRQIAYFELHGERVIVAEIIAIPEEAVERQGPQFVGAVGRRAEVNGRIPGA